MLPAFQTQEHPSFFLRYEGRRSWKMTTIVLGVLAGCVVIVVLHWFEKIWVLAGSINTLAIWTMRSAKTAFFSR